MQLSVRELRPVSDHAAEAAAARAEAIRRLSSMTRTARGLADAAKRTERLLGHGCCAQRYPPPRRQRRLHELLSSRPAAEVPHAPQGSRAVLPAPTLPPQASRRESAATSLPPGVTDPPAEIAAMIGPSDRAPDSPRRARMSLPPGDIRIPSELAAELDSVRELDVVKGRLMQVKRGLERRLMAEAREERLSQPRSRPQPAEAEPAPDTAQPSRRSSAAVPADDALAAASIGPADRVLRNPRHWCWGTQDGSPRRWDPWCPLPEGLPGYGTVESVADGWVWVRWDDGERGAYRWGHAGAYDVMPVDDAPPPPPVPPPAPEPPTPPPEDDTVPPPPESIRVPAPVPTLENAVMVSVPLDTSGYATVIRSACRPRRVGADTAADETLALGEAKIGAVGQMRVLEQVALQLGRTA